MESQEDRQFTVKLSFDETLARHMAANVDMRRQGIPEIPVGLGTVSCLILLAERESEMETFPEDPPDRYTKDTFVEGLEDMGLEVDDTVQGDIDGLVHNGLIEIAADGKFQAKPPAMDMAKQVDEAFPGMPGINLVAYLVQTIDEVLSGRKDLNQAIKQFEQTLGLYGNKKSASRHDTAGTPTATAGPSTDAIKSALSASLRKRQVSQKKSEKISEKPKVVTASGEVVSVEVEDISSQRETPPTVEEIPSDDSSTVSTEGFRDEDVTEDTDVVHDKALEHGIADGLSEVSSSEDDSRNEAGPEESGEIEESEETVEEMPADLKTTAVESVVSDVAGGSEESQQTAVEEPPETSPDENVSLSEEALQEQIAAFEQQLAMSCPVCGSGRIQDQETGKGKIFYNCTNQDCFFVSWGKPYHQECPRCKNPFLIEAAGKSGDTILKCPRATCRHQEPIPGEGSATSGASGRSPKTRRRVRRVVASGSGGPKKKKKVVRRRVVRKKK